MNSVLPYHRGVLMQRGRGIGGVFNSLFRTLLPIGKSVIKSTPKLIKATAKSPLGKKLRKSAKKVAINTARNLLESGNIDQTLKKSIEDSKKRYQIYYSHQKKLEKENETIYHIVNQRNIIF